MLEATSEDVNVDREILEEEKVTVEEITISEAGHMAIMLDMDNASYVIHMGTGSQIACTPHFEEGRDPIKLDHTPDLQTICHPIRMNNKPSELWSVMVYLFPEISEN